MENNYKMNIEGLKDFFKQNNILINDTQAQQLLDFYKILIEKNKVMNLTAITEENEVMRKHFLDSVLPFFLFENMLSGENVVIGYSDKKNAVTGSFNNIKPQKLSIHNVIDIGTGAGFPGIPLAVLCPEINFTLVDSLNKRINFINEFVSSQGLTNLRAVHGRFEDLAHDSFFRGKFDIAVSRAVAPLNVLLEYSVPFIKKNGYFLSYKSRNAEAEIKESGNALKILNTEYCSKISYNIGSDDIDRNVLLFKVISNVSDKYPRKAGTPKKKPL